MSKFIRLALAALPFTFVLANCAVDATEPTSSTDDAVTVIDACATDHQANASLLFNGTLESYTRSGATTDTTCGCSAWQREVNNDNGDETQADIDHPNCRPSTYVDIHWDVSLPILAFEVVVPSWSLTNGSTECLNSRLAVTVWKETSPNVFSFQYSDSSQPPVASDGTCGRIGMGGGGVTGATYRIHARATRGLFEYNHGFETVKISAWGSGE